VNDSDNRQPDEHAGMLEDARGTCDRAGSAHPGAAFAQRFRSAGEKRIRALGPEVVGWPNRKPLVQFPSRIVEVIAANQSAILGETFAQNGRTGLFMGDEMNRFETYNALADTLLSHVENNTSTRLTVC